MTQYTNRLINETSPYLLQHAHNPVDWYPWSEEALERARRENKPILLSIGYSACHWCHVMERESFEDREIARLMNENFVCVKVDREERPDLDQIYMNAVQMLTGQGGWPLTVFLTPEGFPFYGGTYYPPADRFGMPGFPRILRAIAEVWEKRRDEVLKSADAVLKELKKVNRFQPAPEAPGIEALESAAESIAGLFDPVHGGFGHPPKFPSPMLLEFMLRAYLRAGDPRFLYIVEFTLGKMARGGIYDQLGGGFHRYSVDERWLVPHFEKMLYDNAQLALVYLHAYQVTGSALCRRVVEETLDYVLREMTDPAGGFYSTQDADSEGHEGKFFVWTPWEIKEILGVREGEILCRYFGVTENGNFEGKNILHVPREAKEVAGQFSISLDELEGVLARGRGRLFAAREKRARPARDDKVLVAWNGLMLRAFAEAAGCLGRKDYLRAAQENAEFVLGLRDREGGLIHSCKQGQPKHRAFLDDYANYADGLLGLYETTFDLRWLAAAERLVEEMISGFWNEEQGGFYYTPAQHESLIDRPVDFFDSATPSGNAVAADVLLRLALLLEKKRYRDLAERMFRMLGGPLLRFPSAFGRMLCAIDFSLAQVKQIAVVGPREQPATSELLAVVRARYLPNKVLAFKEPGDSEAESRLPLLKGREQLEGRPAAYVCVNYSCQMPAAEPEALARQLE